MKSSTLIVSKVSVQKLLFFVLVLVIAGAIVSCAAANPSPPVSSSTPKTLDLSGQKVTMLAITPHIGTAQALSNWFKEETGAVVQVIEVGYGDMLNRTLEDINAVNPQFDVLTVWYPTLGTLVEANVLVDLSDFISQNDAVLQSKDFIPSFYDPYTLYNGKRWAIPFDGDTHVLFYRRSLLDKYNLTPPETWDDYLQAIQTITEHESANGIYGSAIMANKVPLLIVGSFLNRLGGYGGELFDSEGQPQINDPQAVAALSAMVEQAAYALPTPLETDFDVARDAFLSGKVAIVEGWTDLGLMAEDPSQSIIQGDWGVVQMPMGDGDQARHAPALNAGFSLGISTKAPNPDVAREFLLFATRSDITMRISQLNQGVDPTRISVLTSEEYHEFAPQISEATQAALDGATAWPTAPQMPVLSDELTKNLVAALEGRKTPQQALDDTQASWLEILQQ